MPQKQVLMQHAAEAPANAACGIRTLFGRNDMPLATRTPWPMHRQALVIAFVAIAAFATGFVVRGSIGSSSQTKSRDNGASRSSTDLRPEPGGDGRVDMSAASHRHRDDPARFSLTSRQLDAVLNMCMTDPEVVFVELGLSKSQIQRLQAAELLAEMRDSFHSVELRHSALVEDDGTRFVEISPFPGDRLGWISSVEDRVRQIVDDERTPILARALAARFGLLDTGLFRRQIKFYENNNGELQRAELFFGADGSVVREDVGRALPEETERWETLIGPISN